MRLQILHLPAPPDEYPFAIVLDEVPDHYHPIETRENLQAFVNETGARGMIVSRDVIEIV